MFPSSSIKNSFTLVAWSEVNLSKRNIKESSKIKVSASAFACIANKGAQNSNGQPLYFLGPKTSGQVSFLLITPSKSLSTNTLDGRNGKRYPAVTSELLPAILAPATNN